MKRYEIPEIKISGFSVEDIITDSAAVTAESKVKSQLGETATVLTSDWDDWSIAE